MYNILHLLDENKKVTTLKTDNELIEFIKVIATENDDIEEFTINTVDEAIEYVNIFCDNLAFV